MSARRLLVFVALGAMVLVAPAPASASTTFHPRVRNALGLIPAFGSQDVASGALTPVVYHAGPTMTGTVTIHTIFWAPSGYSFQGSPGSGIPTYRGMLEQFYTDVAHDSTGASGGGCSGTNCNVFTVEPQYAQGLTPSTITHNRYSIAYSTSSPNDITDTNPYPASGQCASPNNAATCLTDAQVQAEIDRVISTVSGSRGLHDLWYVFLPPNVDECISPGVCDTNAYGGYHSVGNLGSGPFMYAVTGDPVIETTIGPGADPQGNPDGEAAVDIAAHETNEAMTDPEGTGWMDPNGFEVGDKCEFGPQHGQPLGYAANGSPYNQVINGHKYWLQEMWANSDSAGNPNCVQASTSTATPLPLPQVSMSQYGSTVSGNTEQNAGGVPVTVTLLRSGDANGTPVTVAQASTTTAGDGSWSVSLAPHAVGDDRDEIDVDYNNGSPGTGVPAVQHQVILTGNGGNPFTESGWLGWTGMDNGSYLTNSLNPNVPGDTPLSGPSISLGPCFQTGEESSSLTAESPTDFCSTQIDVATEPLTGPVSPGTAAAWTSNDNRAFSPQAGPTPNQFGALVSLTVPVGEPDAVSQFVNPLPFFVPSGYPTCAADLEHEVLGCSGLVPGTQYTATDGSNHATGSADPHGDLTVPLAIKRGDTVALSNGSRNVTTLHVADLRADIAGNETTLSGGSCSGGQYYGAPLSSAPTNAAAGVPTAFAGGAALTGQICPVSGQATGLPSNPIVQTDELSGGQTQTEVPDLENTSPMGGEIVYGGFTAVAESGFTAPNNSVTPDSTSRIQLSIVPAAGGAPVFTTSNVNTVNGTGVPVLSPGTYRATWTINDLNGDTRTVGTRFVEQSPLSGPPGPQGPAGPPGPQGKPGKVPSFRVVCTFARHHTIKCTVVFKRSKKTHGRLQMLISRGHQVAALGHASVRSGSAHVSLQERGRVAPGRFTVTLVLQQPGQNAGTARATVRLR